MEAARAITIAAERQRMGMKTKQQKMDSRKLEIQRKIALLKGGGRVARYRKERDEERRSKSGGDEEEEDAGAASETSAESGATGNAPTSAGMEAYWAYKRNEPLAGAKKKVKVKNFEMSDDARAIVSTELSGAGGKASARSVLDAAMELVYAKQLSDAAELFEICRKRIDSDQLNRKIDTKEATAMDQECMWELCQVYETTGKLTLACARYWELRDMLPDSRSKNEAEKRWAQASFKLSENLYKANRFQDSLDMCENIRDSTSKRVNGDSFMEKVELYAAMALQKLDRLQEAAELLQKVSKTSNSRKRRKQADFILDVQRVGEQVSRNDEMHELWDKNWKPTSGQGQGQIRMGGGATMAYLSPRERAFKEWAAEYWETRLKSPFYYAFLVLWVCWPFAIPVVSIMKKSQLLPPS